MISGSWTRRTALLCLTLFHGTAVAEDESLTLRWMPDSSIRSEFSGKALAGVYPGGRTWSEMIFADGTTDYREDIVRRIGKWWVMQLEFCFSYPPPGIGGCFRIIKMSANCYELYEYGSEHGRQDTPPGQRGAWNGRMWRTEAAATCDEKPSV